jgi:hypothetical protein
MQSRTAGLTPWRKGGIVVPTVEGNELDRRIGGKMLAESNAMRRRIDRKREQHMGCICRAPPRSRCSTVCFFVTLPGI